MVIVVGGSRDRVSQSCNILGSNLVCGQKATARTSRTSHGMFVARLMKIRLALARETVKFLETSTCYATLEDAKVLLCIDIERLLVDMVDVVWVGKEVIGEWCVEGILVVI